MSVDIWRGRRTNFMRCEWYEQDIDDKYVMPNQLKYKTRPSGHFYAREENSLSIENNIVGNNIMLDSESITISTYDDVSKIKKNDKIFYRNKYWRVDSIQKAPVKKQQQYLSKSFSNTYFLALRG